MGTSRRGHLRAAQGCARARDGTCAERMEGGAGVSRREGGCGGGCAPLAVTRLALWASAPRHGLILPPLNGLPTRSGAGRHPGLETPDAAVIVLADYRVASDPRSSPALYLGFVLLIEL